MPETVSGLTVLRPGLQSTLQDAGRQARVLGLPAGGAADAAALRLGNALVGNPAGALALEITLHGPRLLFRQSALVALCGAPFDAQLDGQPVALGRAIPVQAGQVLNIGGTPRGARTLLTVRGGFVAPVLFGSGSTHLRGGFGGLEGRALRSGDHLSWHPRPAAFPPAAFLSPSLLTPTGPRLRLRAVPTSEATPELLAHLTAEAGLTVSSQADRMGVRLTEARPAPHDPARVSLPNVPGSVQLPPDGRPILLLPDAGTHGGYATPLVVVQADLPRLGQLRPGDRVGFELVSPAQARTLLWTQERGLRQAEWALRQWYSRQGQ